MFSTKFVEKIKTHIVYSVTFFVENRAVYDIRWKNVIELDRPQMIIWRMRISWWITRTKNTQSEYAILTVFPLQQHLHERTSMLRHAYFAYLVVCTAQLQSKDVLVTVLYGRLFSVLKNICTSCERCSTKLIYRPVQKRGVKARLTFRHRASYIGQAFRYSPENAFYIFNQQIYFII